MINIFVVAAALGAYLIGSIPTGYIIARLKGIKDIRQHGSGNIGATNVSRVLGIQYFFLIFFLDVAKAFLFMHYIKPYFPAEYLYCFAGIFLLFFFTRYGWQGSCHFMWCAVRIKFDRYWIFVGSLVCEYGNSKNSWHSVSYCSREFAYIRMRIARRCFYAVFFCCICVDYMVA